MLKLNTIRDIIDLMTLFFAYLVVITPVGWFRAWVSQKMGDDTQEEYGLLSLNPIDHIDSFGLIFLFLMGIGWGRYVPINIGRIKQNRYYLRLTTALFADSVGYIVCLLIFTALIMATLFFSFTGVTPLTMQQIAPSSIAIVIVRILQAAVELSILLFIVRFISSITTLLSIHLFEKYPNFREPIYYLSFFLPLMLILLLHCELRYFLHSFLGWVQVNIAYLLGIR
jgi:hypothetical protein